MQLSFTTLVTAGLVLTTAFTANAQSPAESLVKVGGYVDAQYRSVKDDSVNSGFMINEGAVYLNHTAGAAEIVIDLPFMREKRYSAVSAVTGQSNGFAVGGKKAQAYVGYNVGDTRLQLGQFDTFYGFEVNDAPDIMFSTQGLIYENAIPVTHTGAMVQHKMGGFTGRLMGANASNEGQKSSMNTEYGAQAAWSNDNYRAALGYMTMGKFGDNRNLIDALVGATFGSFSFDVEYVSLKDITAAVAPATTNTAETGTGFLVQPAYQITKELSVAVRYEQISKINAIYDAKQTTGGFQYLLTKNLKGKIDFTSGETQLTAASTTKVKNETLALAAVYKF